MSVIGIIIKIYLATYKIKIFRNGYVSFCHEALHILWKKHILNIVTTHSIEAGRNIQLNVHYLKIMVFVPGFLFTCTNFNSSEYEQQHCKEYLNDIRIDD